MALKHFCQENDNIYQGYFPFLKNDVSHKEMIDWIRPNFNNSSAWELENCPLYHENPWLSSTNIRKRAE